MVAILGHIKFCSIGPLPNLAPIISSSSSSLSLESDELRHSGENATSLWQLELQLMAIFASMAGSTRTFPVRFNENAAW